MENTNPTPTKYYVHSDGNAYWFDEMYDDIACCPLNNDKTLNIKQTIHVTNMAEPMGEPLFHQILSIVYTIYDIE